MVTNLWKFRVNQVVCDPEAPVDQFIERLAKEANLIPFDIFYLKESNENSKKLNRFIIFRKANYNVSFSIPTFEKNTIFIS